MTFLMQILPNEQKLGKKTFHKIVQEVYKLQQGYFVTKKRFLTAQDV